MYPLRSGPSGVSLLVKHIGSQKSERVKGEIAAATRSALDARRVASDTMERGELGLPQ